ncbi:Hypothetical protein BC94_0456 [Mycoplasmopsis bovis]|uniref:Uncharacterized protein n=1 Tax=Mycoplasmopsis bovis TaxID=28903 RepID=A0A8D4A1Q8_MYCBV|nr:Hypothetical protein BC85_0455 [Mycoplasmopsis bovis]AMW25739.1 Hypothetical protein BC94_0456 [Mycoplasmopsis bovis]AMW26367.1 Hypothetical protein BC93_0455 [Mycoplasmopsis bovis]
MFLSIAIYIGLSFLLKRSKWLSLWYSSNPDSPPIDWSGSPAIAPRWSAPIGLEANPVNLISLEISLLVALLTKVTKMSTSPLVLEIFLLSSFCVLAPLTITLMLLAYFSLTLAFKLLGFSSISVGKTLSKGFEGPKFESKIKEVIFDMSVFLINCSKSLSLSSFILLLSLLILSVHFAAIKSVDKKGIVLSVKIFFILAINISF